MALEGMLKGKLYRLGSSGSVVQTMQIRLAALGYPLRGTGYFGAATDTALRAEQRKLGLVVDGVLGPNTARALDAAEGPATKSEAREVGRPLWLQAGLALLGTKEFSGGRDNPVILDWARVEGGNIEKAYTHDSIPWCALFANYILTKASLPGTETLWALDFAGKWPAKRLADIAVGAFAPMVRDGGGHIMVVVGRDQHGNVMGLGGNQSDAVTIAPFARSRLNKGFWWPESVALPAATGFSSLPIVASNGKVSGNER